MTEKPSMLKDEIEKVLNKYFQENSLITDPKIIIQMNKGYSMFDQALTRILELVGKEKGEK